MSQWQLLTELLCHNLATPELGAVLAPASSTVALGPLLAGIKVELRSSDFGQPLPALDAAAEPLMALGTSFLHRRVTMPPLWDPATAGMTRTTTKISP